MTEQVKIRVDLKRVMFAGMRQDGLTEQESSFNDRHNLTVVPPAAFVDSSEPIMEWIKQNDIKYLAIHFDLEVLDPKKIQSTFFG